MAQTAAHLVDHVIAQVPVRQRVLSLPIPLRLLLAAQPQAGDTGAAGGAPRDHALVVPQEPEAPAQAVAPAECEANCAHHRAVRLSWARLRPSGCGTDGSGPKARDNP
jgi:hypothetical protein